MPSFFWVCCQLYHKNPLSVSSISWLCTSCFSLEACSSCSTNRINLLIVLLLDAQPLGQNRSFFSESVTLEQTVISPWFAVVHVFHTTVWNDLDDCLSLSWNLKSKVWHCRYWGVWEWWTLPSEQLSLKEDCGSIVTTYWKQK